MKKKRTQGMKWNQIKDKQIENKVAVLSDAARRNNLFAGTCNAPQFASTVFGNCVRVARSLSATFQSPFLTRVRVNEPGTLHRLYSMLLSVLTWAATWTRTIEIIYKTIAQIVVSCFATFFSQSPSPPLLLLLLFSRVCNDISWVTWK